MMIIIMIIIMMMIMMMIIVKSSDCMITVSCEKTIVICYCEKALLTAD